MDGTAAVADAAVATHPTAGPASPGTARLPAALALAALRPG
jgi:hypothetical protein